MFVFLNKRRDMVKMLWRDATGWCLLAKRLERRLIELPKSFDQAAEARPVRKTSNEQAFAIATVGSPRPSATKLDKDSRAEID